jgi:hypothetical protein
MDMEFILRLRTIDSVEEIGDLAWKYLLQLLGAGKQFESED